MHTRAAFRLEILLSAIFAFLAALTLVWRDWIEGVFGVDPDNHNGSFEWLIVAALALAALGCFGLARRHWHRLAAES